MDAVCVTDSEHHKYSKNPCKINVYSALPASILHYWRVLSLANSLTVANGILHCTVPEFFKSATNFGAVSEMLAPDRRSRKLFVNKESDQIQKTFCRKMIACLLFQSKLGFDLFSKFRPTVFFIGLNRHHVLHVKVTQIFDVVRHVCVRPDAVGWITFARGFRRGDPNVDGGVIHPSESESHPTMRGG